MNIIKVKIDFAQGICKSEGISIVQGDYNSTKVVFEFDESAENKTKIFEMKNPSNELVYADEILGNEVILVGTKEVEGQEEIVSLFNEEGDYTFEVSLYGNDSKLTSVCGYITARKEEVIVDGEQVEQQLTLFDNLINDLNEKITEANNLNIDAEKVDKTTTITITKKDGTQEEVEILDGIGLNYNWLDTSLGIKREDEQEYQYVNLKGDKGDAGAIKMIIVNELPETGQEDTIYLVPLETPESQENKYAEYVYINNAWELLGKIGIEVDLTDYYTKTETNSLLDNKQNKITNDNKLSASLVSGLSTVATSGSYNDLSNKPNLSVYELSSNKVTSISSSSTDTQYPSAKCVYDLIGNLETILTTLDIGGGAN